MFRGPTRLALRRRIGPALHVASGLAIALHLFGCAQDSAKGRAAVQHVVVCWLKDAGDTAGRRALIEVSKGFAEIPGVVSVRAGEPQPSNRRNVDASFDVAIVMEFEDRRALAAYLDHPRHRAAVREVLAPLTSRVVIYDFEDRALSGAPAP